MCAVVRQPCRAIRRAQSAAWAAHGDGWCVAEGARLASDRATTDPGRPALTTAYAACFDPPCIKRCVCAVHAGACGGTLACSTCHLYIDQESFDKLPEIDEEEEDMLDLAIGLEDL